MIKVLLIGAALVLLISDAASAAGSRCTVTDVAPSGLVTAAEVNGTRQLQFEVSNKLLLRSVRVGSPVYANFESGQISLDGRTTCCRILRIKQTGQPAAANSNPAAARAPAPSPSPSRASAPSPSSSGAPASLPSKKPAPQAEKPAASASQVGGQEMLLASSSLPKLSFGPLQKIDDSDWRSGTLKVLQFQNASLKHLRGNEDIARSTGLPQPVKDVLWLHARTLEAQELDTYIVIPDLADAWAKQLPNEMKQMLRQKAADDGKKKKKGCSTKHISSGCVKNEVDQAVDDLTKAARRAWEDTVDEWGRIMNQVENVEACFRERRLTATGPLRFDIAPSVGLSFAKDGKGSNKHGGASGKVTGNVNLGVPIRVDAVARLDVFYIPCLPFVVRPRSLGADGSLEAEGRINARIDADGEFNQLFAVPPAGGVQIPVAVIPIALGGVPIAVLDASIYLDGTLEVEGRGTLDGNVGLTSTQLSRFSFECSGHGCDLAAKGTPAPATAVESFQLNGQVKVKPAIYTALQLGLNYDLLNARAGPQPFLLADIRGCAAAAASQSTTGSSSAEAFHAVTADLDWGIELRAEALAAGKKVAQSNWLSRREHLLFRNLATSSALLPTVTGAMELAAGQPASFTIKMPPCYPYAEPMQYLVQWTGPASATAAAPSSAAVVRRAVPGRSGSSPPTSCTQQSAQQGTCEGAPLNDTVLYIAWPASGEYLLTVSPKQDKHGRKFDSARSATQLTISVK